jgi:hypothetical protein
MQWQLDDVEGDASKITEKGKGRLSVCLAQAKHRLDGSI